MYVLTMVYMYYINTAHRRASPSGYQLAAGSYGYGSATMIIPADTTKDTPSPILHSTTSKQTT